MPSIDRATRARRNPGRNEEMKEMNVWHDDGDDGVTGWQPIGESLVRTSNEGTNS